MKKIFFVLSLHLFLFSLNAQVEIYTFQGDRFIIVQGDDKTAGISDPSSHGIICVFDDRIEITNAEGNEESSPWVFKKSEDGYSIKGNEVIIVWDYTYKIFSWEIKGTRPAMKAYYHVEPAELYQKD